MLLGRLLERSWDALSLGRSWQLWARGGIQSLSKIASASWRLLVALGVLLALSQPLVAPLGRSWGGLGGLLGALGRVLGVLGRSLDAWDGLGAVWAPSCDGPGAVLGRCWAFLGRLGRVLSPSWRVWGGLGGPP